MCPGIAVWPEKRRCGCKRCVPVDEHARLGNGCPGLCGVTRTNCEDLDTLRRCVLLTPGPTTRQVPWGWFILQAVGHFLSTLRYPLHIEWRCCSSSSQGKVCARAVVRLVFGPLRCFAGACRPLSKETQNFTAVHGTIPRLRYDGPEGLRGTCVHLLCSSFGEYHDHSSCGLSFCSSAPGCYLHLQVPGLATLTASVMPGKESRFCGLAEDPLCVVASGSVAPAGASSSDSWPADFLSCAHHRLAACGRHTQRFYLRSFCQNFSIARPARADAPAGAFLS